MSRHTAPDVPLLAQNSDVPDSARLLSDLKTAPAPFSAHDITAGTENELQAAVVGHAADVDLPLAIRSSNYFKNVLKRAAAGESPRRVLTQLEEYVSSERAQAWDNSWVRLRMSTLTPSTRVLVYQDLQGIVFQRYGATEPKPADFESGSGQHVGTVFEIASRLQTALYFIGSRWPDPELRQSILGPNAARLFRFR